MYDAASQPYPRTECEKDEMSTNPVSASEMRFEWATAEEVQKHFTAAMNDLFCLAFLLTAHAGRAEECVIRSIRECMKSTQILREGLPAWIRNSVIRNGIAMVNEANLDLHQKKDEGSIPVIPFSSHASAGTADYSAGILELSSFERLVYVICVLERYSSRHCGLLLRKSREEVREARIRALAYIAEFESKWRELSMSSTVDTIGTVDRPELHTSSCGCLLD
jgi:hypothetical protein